MGDHLGAAGHESNGGKAEKIMRKKATFNIAHSNTNSNHKRTMSRTLYETHVMEMMNYILQKSTMILGDL